MLGFRTLTCLTLAATAITGTIGHRSRIISRADSGIAEPAAWALLAETDELCRSHCRQRRDTGSAAGSVARLAVAEEALEIVRELAVPIGDEAMRTALLGAAEQLERRCSCSPCRECRVPPGPRDMLGRVLASLDGSGRQERNALITPYLERLNDAASREVEHNRNRLAYSVAASVTRPAHSAPESVPEVESSAESGPVSASRSEPHPPPPRLESEPRRIVIGTTTSRHRERAARWSLVFEREARALRTSRRDLQVEIERYSLARSRSACRAFDAALAGLDAELEEGAPSRGLSLRIASMVGWYRRGVAECAAGRPAAAFAYLSEGDREWALVAQIAAGMFAPRPLRARGGGSPAAGARSLIGNGKNVSFGNK